MASLQPSSCRDLGTIALLLSLLHTGKLGTESLDEASSSASCTHSSLVVSRTFLSSDSSISASVCLSNTLKSSVRNQVNYFLLPYSVIPRCHLVKDVPLLNNKAKIMHSHSVDILFPYGTFLARLSHKVLPFSCLTYQHKCNLCKVTTSYSAISPKTLPVT